MIVPTNTVFYIERRPDYSLVFQKDDSGQFQKVQKFAEFEDAKRFVKDVSGNNYFFYDKNGDRLDFAP